MEKNIEKKTMILLGIFTSALVIANLIGSKLTTIFGISVSVGIFAVPITFLCTDIVEEVRGREITKQFINIGIIALLITFFLVLISLYLSPASRYESNDAFTTVFKTSLRMIFASIIAFTMAQYHDIWAFNIIKKKTKGKYLWLRNNISTMFSQLIDTTVFMFIAFYGITPKFNVTFIISLIIPYWCFKILFAAIDTPLVYLGVKWLKR
jgi:queuosine precursor transporter